MWSLLVVIAAGIEFNVQADMQHDKWWLVQNVRSGRSSAAEA